MVANIQNQYELAVINMQHDLGLDRQQAIDLLGSERCIDDKQLNDYFEFFWGVKVPMKAHCSNCKSPFQPYADVYFSRYMQVILKASRGSGKSMALTALALTIQCTMATDVFILGGSESQSQVVIKYLMSESSRNGGLFWECPNAPRGLKDPKRENKSSNVLINKGQILCLPASEKNVRSKRPTFLLCDEVDELDNDLLESALGCPKNDELNKIRAAVMLVSTHQYTDGTLAHRMKRAQERNEAFQKKYPQGRIDPIDGELKREVIPIFGYCYKDVLEENGGWQTLEEIERIKEMLSEETWISQYECGEPQSVNRIFRREQIEFMFDKNIPVLGHEHRLGKEIVEQESTEYQTDLHSIFPETAITYEGSVKVKARINDVMESLDYGCGADFANMVDWSVFAALTRNPFDDSSPYVMAAYARYGRLPKFTEIVSKWDQFVFKYPGGAYHDETGNLCINDIIESDSEGFYFTKNKKKELLDAYIIAVQNGQIKCPDIDYIRKEHQFLTLDQVEGRSHLPDSVAAFALAYKSATESVGELHFDLIGG